MKNLVTKKNVFIFSSALAVALLFVGYFQEKCYENAHSLCWQYWDKIPDDIQVFYLMFPIFFFSLITYKLRDEVFESWMKFAKWWVLGTIVLVVITPAQDHSMIPLDKEMISLFSTGIFTAVSLVVVVIKSISLRGK